MENKLISNTAFGKYCKSKKKDFKIPLDYLIWYEKTRNNFDNFIEQPLELGMLVACDENNMPLEEPVFNGDHDLLEYKHQEFMEAKERVLFEGFHLLGIEDNIAEIELKNADLWITFIGKKAEVTNQFSQQYSVYTIEGLIQEDLTLTPNAIKQIYGK